MHGVCTRTRRPRFAACVLRLNLHPLTELIASTDVSSLVQRILAASQQLTNHIEITMEHEVAHKQLAAINIMFAELRNAMRNDLGLAEQPDEGMSIEHMTWPWPQGAWDLANPGGKAKGSD